MMHEFTSVDPIGNNLWRGADWQKEFPRVRLVGPHDVFRETSKMFGHFAGFLAGAAYLAAHAGAAPTGSDEAAANVPAADGGSADDAAGMVEWWVALLSSAGFWCLGLSCMAVCCCYACRRDSLSRSSLLDGEGGKSMPEQSSVEVRVDVDEEEDPSTPLKWPGYKPAPLSSRPPASSTRKRAYTSAAASMPAEMGAAPQPLGEMSYGGQILDQLKRLISGGGVRTTPDFKAADGSPYGSASKRGETSDGTPQKIIDFHV